MHKLVLLIVIRLLNIWCKLPIIFRTKKIKNSVFFFAAFFPENAGYHWRVQKWNDILNENGYQTHISTAFKREEFYTLKDTNSSKLLFKAMLRRFRDIRRSRKYETVLVRRELLIYNDYGNLFLEKLLLKHHPKAILDFDDDIAAAKSEPRTIHSLYGKLALENGNKFNESLNLYKKYIVPSQHLANYIIERNKTILKHDILILPTCVDYDEHSAKEYTETRITTFGWIGGNYNQVLIDNVISGLNIIAKSRKIELIVISGKKYTNETAIFPITNLPWHLDTEVESLKKIDIGLMPLNSKATDKGKAGFKLVQYMGLGITSVASDVTINSEIIPSDEFGYLKHYDETWESVLKRINYSRQNLASIGSNARKQIRKNYSFNGNTNNFITFIKRI